MLAATTAARRRSRRRGQAALEYVLVFLALVVAVYAAYRFLASPGRVTGHTLDVICSERL